ncbi:hypothetical protein GA0061096_4441 [Fictibacillus enclensis]|uniref:Uncharacterized protein n=1 Tax=Fictibacillus enclensis TaxID=1017270 RepID=A0A0V8IY34_9BACL|nr:hypothetical protein [Fictibacillus enclensis]KSU79761.1 hypothetical protein AS030_21160 [Fictibacillus enclensis]SCC39552.1 hypothetical protein GA0061096_4441 [Fictibacillus enclensis]
MSFRSHPIIVPNNAEDTLNFENAKVNNMINEKQTVEGFPNPYTLPDVYKSGGAILPILYKSLTNN